MRIPVYVGAALAGSLAILAIGSFISYPPYARLGAFTFFVLSLGLIALGSDEVKEESEEGLGGEAGEGTEPSGELSGEPESKGKKRDGKKTRKSKAKGK